jgi:hypothetical protein
MIHYLQLPSGWSPIFYSYSIWALVAHLTDAMQPKALEHSQSVYITLEHDVIRV